MAGRSPTLQVRSTTGGTWTLYLHRPDGRVERWRSGIPSRAEAVQRAQVVADLCGYVIGRTLK